MIHYNILLDIRFNKLNLNFLNLSILYMFKVFYIDNCGFSSNTLSILDKLKLKYNKILCNNNNYELDEDYKNVINYYTTYPKIFYKTKNKTIFIGGNAELESLINLSEKLIKNNKELITPQKYIDNKTTNYLLIKLIKLINKIKYL